MKKIALAASVLSLLALILFEAKTGYIRSAPWNKQELPISRGYYTVKKVTGEINTSAYKLPDISKYTVEEIKKKRPEKTVKGKVNAGPIEDIVELSKFTEQTYQPIMHKLQPDGDPIGVVVKSGVYTLATLTEELHDPKLMEFKDGFYYVYVPVAVSAGATLIIEGTDEDKLKVRLSSTRGGFLINSGKMFIINADITGWDEQEEDYSYFEEKKKFRPFLASWNGSESYYAKSSFRHLGFAASKSYGITFSSDKTLMKLPKPPPAPRGWIVESYFEGLLYAFYSYEAEDVVVVHSEYADNIVYAIDPHDRSSRLIFAYNNIHGTKQKHGIIGSRHVNDSFFFNNHTHDNRGSGIMLDRSCLRNVIVNNTVENNGNDGITIFESPNNIIEGNTVRYNGKSGLRVRNSWSVHSRNNTYYMNKGVALQIYTLDLATNSDRDLELDPFSIRADLTSIGDTAMLNEGGELKFHDFDYVRIKGLKLKFPTEDSFREDMSYFRTSMVSILTHYPEGIEVRRKLTAGPIEPTAWQPSNMDGDMAKTLKTAASAEDEDESEEN